MPEVAGDAALIVKPYNIDEIRTGFIKINNDDNYRNSLIEIGHKNVERFFVKLISQKYYVLYNKME